VGPRASLDDTEQKIFDTTGTRIPTPRSSSPQPLAIPTALSRLHPITQEPMKNKVHVLEFQGRNLLYLRCISGALTGIQLCKINCIHH
jgi:hypothetical protein